MRTSASSVLHFCTDFYQSILQWPTFPGGISLQLLVLAPQVSAQPQACAWGRNTGSSCNPSEELSFCCSCIKDRAWKKFKSNSKECYICYQLRTCCLVVTCTNLWVEKNFFARFVSILYIQTFCYKVCYKFVSRHNFMLTFIYLLHNIILAETGKCTESYKCKSFKGIQIVCSQ